MLIVEDGDNRKYPVPLRRKRPCCCGSALQAALTGSHMGALQTRACLLINKLICFLFAPWRTSCLNACVVLICLLEYFIASSPTSFLSFFAEIRLAHFMNLVKSIKLRPCTLVESKHMETGHDSGLKVIAESVR